MTSETPSDGPAFPDHFFRRQDTNADRFFYAEPRFVTHIDDSTIEALTQAYRETIPPGSDVLDLMSSWISHLPPEVDHGRVAGLGMSATELAENPQLSDYIVHDLNADPELPYEEASFDFVVNAVSVQYLTRPQEVFASVARVLRPGGSHIVAFSHRMFPTKAVAVWQSLSNDDRIRLVASYFSLAGGYGEPMFVDRSPAEGDPLFLVIAQRPAEGAS